MFAVVVDTSSHFLIFKLQLGHLTIAVLGASGILDLQFVQMQIFFTSTANIVLVNTAAKRTAHEYKFELPVNNAFPVTY